jgi:hypothetical protein
MLEPVLIQELHLWLKTVGFRPHIYHYLKDGKMMYGLYLYGVGECQAFLSKVGLIGKRRRQLTNFLRSRGQASPAR